MKLNPYNKGRYFETSNKYKFDRYIFRGAMILIFIYLFAVMLSYNFDFTTNVYTKCDDLQGCENPFLDPLMEDKHKNKCIWEWCEQETLPYGFEFGRKPNLLFKLSIPITILILTFAFIINHLRYNKGKQLIEV